jgi:hypothetical protein
LTAPLRLQKVIVHQRAEEASRTPGKSCCWVAETIIDGRTFTARSRRGAANELARVLTAAAIPDAPMHVYTHGIRGCLTTPSFHEVAIWTYEESASVPLHRIPYARVEAARERARSAGVAADLLGVNDLAAPMVAPERLTA